MKNFYCLETVSQNAHLFVKSKSYPKGKVLIKEGDKSLDLYLIKEGILAMTKHLGHLSSLKTQLASPLKLDLNPVLLNIGRGDLFGEDTFFFSRPSTYTLTVASATAVILSLSKEDFQAAYPKLFRHEPLKHFFDARKTLSADLAAKSIPISLETQAVMSSDYERAVMNIQKEKHYEKVTAQANGGMRFKMQRRYVHESLSRAGKGVDTEKREAE